MQAVRNLAQSLRGNKAQSAGKKDAKTKEDFAHFDTKLCKSYAKYTNLCEDKEEELCLFFLSLSLSIDSF